MRFYCALLLLLTVTPHATGASPETQLDVTVCWNGAYRPGRWTPVYVSASDAKPRQVICEIGSAENCFEVPPETVNPKRLFTGTM